MLRELEGEDRIVVGDLEAGIGTLVRMGDHGADLAIVVSQPTAKSMDVAARALRIAAARSVPAVLIANRVTGPEDVQLIQDTVAPEVEVEVFVVPDDPDVARADEEGTAPLDTAAGSPAVLAVEALARAVPRLGRKAAEA
ncbi:MAG: hypothetical protein WKF94_12155 [Solirubrobacteraceae bacterium]